MHIHNHKVQIRIITFSTLFGARLIAFEGHFTPGLSRSPFGRTLTLGALRATVPRIANGHALTCHTRGEGTRIIYPVVYVYLFSPVVGTLVTVT